MKKIAIISILFLSLCVSAFASQVINVPHNLTSQLVQDWTVTGPMEAISVINPNNISINVIVSTVMRDESGNVLNGINLVCNGASNHVNAGSYIVCQTTGNVFWSSDFAVPGALSKGSVSIDTQGLKK